MTDDDPSDEIARLEARLEQLGEVAERCRKIILASKLAIGVGGVLLCAMMFGFFVSSELALGSIAAVLGGIVSLGSNVSTLRQTMETITAAEAQREGLIDGIDLRVVGEDNATLH